MRGRIPIVTMTKMEGEEFYRQAMGILNEAEIPFLVGGAFALRAHTSIARETKDFDLMMRRGDVTRALEVLHAAGYRAEIVYTHWLAKVWLGHFFIDVIYSSGNGLCEIDDGWFARAKKGTVFGETVWLCPPEEIIWQKAFVMERERFDGADVLHLIASCAEHLDWAVLRERFGDDWRVLYAHLVLFGYVYPAKRKLVPQELLAEFAARVQGERSGEDNLCNGSLLSREQYLPDLEEEKLRDGRQVRGTMTEEEVSIWTAAIDRRGH